MNINKRVWVLMPFVLIGLMAFQTPELDRTVNPPEGIVVDPCAIENSVFHPGEEITYTLYYNWKFVWLAAGEVVFRVDETQDGKYHIVVDGTTYQNYDWFYEVRDRYESIVDSQTLLPEVSIRDIHEGKYRLYDKITFDHANNKATSLRGKSKTVATPTTYDIDACMHDILSIIYYTRNLDFINMGKGTQIPIKIFVDKKEWPLTITYDGKKIKRIKGQGKHKTFVFGPEVIEGYVFKETDKMKVYVSDDNNRIPLLIESPIKVGSVKAVLKSYKGLRHDLESRVRKQKG